jgi:hypothetical protein
MFLRRNPEIHQKIALLMTPTKLNITTADNIFTDST